MAGSSADNTAQGGQTTLLVAGVVAVAAAAVVAGGLLGNSGPTGKHRHAQLLSRLSLISALCCLAVPACRGCITQAGQARSGWALCCCPPLLARPAGRQQALHTDQLTFMGR